MSNQKNPPARNSQEINILPNEAIAEKAIAQLLQTYTVKEYMDAIDEWYSDYMVHTDDDKATKINYTDRWKALKYFLGALLDYEVQLTLEHQ